MVSQNLRHIGRLLCKLETRLSQPRTHAAQALTDGSFLCAGGSRAGLQFAKAYSCGAQDSMVVVRTRVPGSARMSESNRGGLIEIRWAHLRIARYASTRLRPRHFRPGDYVVRAFDGFPIVGISTVTA